jgi:hypothetical protein
MNLLLPLHAQDPLLAQAAVMVSDVPIADEDAIPSRSTYGDIPPSGACEDRRQRFERAKEGVRWICGDLVVPEGGAPQVEKVRTVSARIPATAEILDVRYFHRSRGDSRAPVEEGPWMANAPGDDLQWMHMTTARVRRGIAVQDVEVDCRNKSHNLRMFCAIGVQYREGAWLW